MRAPRSGGTPPPGPSAAGSPDLRASERAPIMLRVDYKRLNTFFADYTKNISKGGTFIRTTKLLGLGTEFVFVLTLPARRRPAARGAPQATPTPDAGENTSENATGDRKLTLRGVVKWVVTEKEQSEERPAGMGIQFKFDSDSERQTIHDFVERLMADNLGSHISERLIKHE